MNKKLLTIGAAFTMMLGAAPTKVASQAKADAPDLKINKHDELMFDRLTNLFNQDANAYYNFLEDWYEDDTETIGLNFYKDYKESVDLYGEFSIGDFTQEYIDEGKNFFYFYLTFTGYLLNSYSTTVDDVRCLLDHLMGQKDDFVFAVGLGCNETLAPGTEDSKNFFETTAVLYDGMIDFAVETFVTDDVTLDKVFDDFKEYMGEYLYNDKLIYRDSLNDDQLGLIKQTSILTGLSDDFMKDALKDYSNPTKVGQFGFDVETIVNFSDDTFASLTEEERTEEEKKYFNVSFNALLYTQETINYVIFYSPEDFCASMFLANTIGPLSYKILDLIEAYKDVDYPNIIILSLEVINDCLNLREYFEGEITGDKENEAYICEAVNACVTSKEKAVLDLISLEIEDNDELTNVINSLNYISEYLKTLKEKMETFYDACLDEKVNAVIERISLNISSIAHFKEDTYNRYLNLRYEEYQSFYTTLLSNYTHVDDVYENDYLKADEYKTDILEIVVMLSLLDGSVQEDVEYFGDSSVFVSVASDLNELGDKCAELVTKIESNAKYKQGMAEFEPRFDEINSKYQLIKATYELDAENLEKNMLDIVGILGKINDFKEDLVSFISEVGNNDEITEMNESLTTIRVELSDFQQEIYQMMKDAETNKVSSVCSELEARINNLLNNADSFSYSGSMEECDDIITKIDAAIELIDETATKIGDNQTLSELRQKFSQHKASVEDKKDEISGAHKRNIALIIIGCLLFVILVLALLYFFGFKKRFLRKENKVKES